MRFSIIPTTWGAFGYVEHGGKLVETLLPRDEKSVRREIARKHPDAVESKSALPAFRRAVESFFAGKQTAFTVPIVLDSVSRFTGDVLRECARIPYGQTISYAELARRIGRPGAARAVGGALGRNPLPIVVPCHRVVASDFSLGGFSSPGGLKEKARLLDLEAKTLRASGKPITRTIRKARVA